MAARELTDANGRRGSVGVVRVGVGGAALGAGLAVAIELLGDARLGLHELAGGILLVVTAALLLASSRVRPAAVRRRVLASSLLTLAALVGMGATGAALATGALGPVWDRLPLVFLAGYVALSLATAWLARSGP